jgi:hypothetical protein
MVSPSECALRHVVIMAGDRRSRSRIAPDVVGGVFGSWFSWMRSATILPGSFFTSDSIRAGVSGAIGSNRHVPLKNPLKGSLRKQYSR